MPIRPAYILAENYSLTNALGRRWESVDVVVAQLVQHDQDDVIVTYIVPVFFFVQ